MRIFFLSLLMVVFAIRPAALQAQTQIVRGTVTDQFSNAPVAFANVVILKTDPVLGTTTDSLGNFSITGVPVGRYDVQVSNMGYEPYVIKEVEVTSAKEVVLAFPIKENTTHLEAVTIKPHTNKERPLNNMATVSARMLSVEEAQRYAGGFDDPARLASSFAGVASNVGDNGIVVRGNAPQYLQWKMEGIEIPNPNHFADLASFGGGGLTALSTQMLANSDFFTGAFPAEYGNALSGIFDIFMRAGNNQEHENTFQMGLIGIDASSEGPFKEGGKSSYLFNYRYSTLALAAPLLPDNAGGARYQDLSFKLNFPTKKSGTFSVWGIGLKDYSGAKVKTDSAEWKYITDRQQQDVNQYMGAGGITHKYFLNNSTYIKTTLAATTSGMDLTTQQLNSASVLQPQNKINNTNSTFVLSSFVNKKFSPKHTNKTGILVTGLMYNMKLDNAPVQGGIPQTIADQAGFSTLVSAYSSSSINLTDKLVLNAGINTQFFTLNSHYTIEPRLGIKWQFSQDQSLGFAYGLHSRLERLNYYFITSPLLPGNDINKNLDFTKAHHFVLGYDVNISSNLHFKAEAYFQWLYNVPVIADSSFSILNIQNNWFFDQPLVNKGNGRNYGLDLTLEKFLSKGYYYLVTASLFSSEYKGGDGVWRNTLYDRNYLLNLLVGKEWPMGKKGQNKLGANIRFTYQGGDRYTPVDEAASVAAKDVIYDYQNAFQQQVPATFVAHLTVSYKINRKKASHEFSLKLINATMQQDFYGFQYNYLNNTVEKNEQAVFIPNVSYKISF